MKKVALVCILLVTTSGQRVPTPQINVPNPPPIASHQIDVPVPELKRPGQYKVMPPGEGNPQEPCSDKSALLEIIADLGDQESVNNEITYEQSNHLTSDQILSRRTSVVKAGITALQSQIVALQLHKKVQ